MIFSFSDQDELILQLYIYSTKKGLNIICLALFIYEKEL